jgi:hypothetical protein
MKAEYDMKKAKRGAIVAPVGKTGITIYLDDATLAAFANAPRLKDGTIKP